MKAYAKRLHTNFLSRFCVLILLPFVLIVTFLIYQSNIISRENDQTINEKLSSQIIYNISNNLSFAEDVASSILRNEMLVNFLDKPYQSQVDLDYYSKTIYDYVKISNGLASDLKLRIYLKNESIPLGYSTFYHLKDVAHIKTINDFYYYSNKDTLWVDGGNIEGDTSYPGLNSQKNYCFMQKIKIGSEKIGLIFIQMRKTILFETNVLMGDKLEQDYVLTPTDKKLIYNFTDKPINDKALLSLENLATRYSSDTHHIYGVYDYLPYPFDVVVATEPNSSRFVVVFLLIVFLIVITTATIFFLRYNNKVINDIHYCLDAMNESITHNFNNDLYVDRKDEISYIAERINYLIERIRKLIKTNINQQVAAKGTQLIALQHQINPHFLYNTMEIFSSRMELNGLFEDSAAMSAFCRILRYNINSDTMLATIEDELLQVDNYIKIQSIRDVDIDYQIEISDDLYKAPIIRFVLQPFVENSFKYRRQDQPLIIYINVTKEGQLIKIQIQDSGVGISPDKIKHLNEAFQADTNGVFRADKEIGLFNINERLKLFYGKDHYIRVSSEEGKTTFTIIIADDITYTVGEN
ncbi:MAG: histidine kinase [Oscillospiraceae bacterium]